VSSYFGDQSISEQFLSIIAIAQNQAVSGYNLLIFRRKVAFLPNESGIANNRVVAK
jgi:hypothetical protein